MEYKAPEVRRLEKERTYHERCAAQYRHSAAHVATSEKMKQRILDNALWHERKLVHVAEQLCNAQHPGSLATKAEITYTVHGFNLIGTGGNCTAFHKPLSGKRHILITAEDAQAPTSEHEAVDVGLYRDGEGDALDTFTAADLDNAIAVIAAKGWAK